MRTFYSGVGGKPTDLLNFAGKLSLNTSSDNLDLLAPLIQDSYHFLIQKYFSNEASTTILTVGDQQDYPLPFDYSKLKTGTLTIGSLRWTPPEILSRQDWDRLNPFPYYSDIPNNFFIWNGNFSLWPIPATGSTKLTVTGLTGTLTSGDIITAGSAVGKILTSTATTIQVAVSSETAFANGAFTTSGGASGTITATAITVGNRISFNYKRRVTDLTFSDYTTGTVTATNGSAVITGAGGMGWVANYLPSAGSVFNLNLWIKFTSPLGDGNWYQISTLDSATQLTLVNKYQGGTTSGASYVIGQMPLILEDFHELIVFDAVATYFSTIVDNPTKKKEFQDAFNEGIAKADEYINSKALNINLRGAINTINPNIYQSSIGGTP